MTQLPSHLMTQPEQSGIKRIIPFGGTLPDDNATQSEKPSVYLYMSALGVTLSALYAVTLGIELPAFSLLTFVLAILGYGTSFFMRHRSISVKSIQTPALIVIALLLLMAWSGDGGLAFLFPVVDANDRGVILQLAFVWFAIIHVFTISTDSGILFQCVPSMTMIALASTHSSDPRVQYAFLTFTASATFLMIHENFLRSRRGKILNANALHDKRLFGGQVQLAVTCVVLAFLFANVVAIPIQNVGESLGISQSISEVTRGNTQTAAAASRAAVFTESQSIDVSGGPNDTSNLVVMRVQSGRSLYWRGKTFDFYDGRAFRDTAGEVKALEAEPFQPDSQQRARDYTSFGSAADNASTAILKRYRVPTSPLELPPAAMRESAELQQRVTVENGVFKQLYGAGNVTEIRAGTTPLDHNSAGAFQIKDMQAIQNQYTVISQVPSDNEGLLRAADPDAIPENIRRYYLQLPPLKPEDSTRIQSLVAEITKGKKTAFDKMEAIRFHLSSHVKYNLRVERTPADRDAVLYLLDDTKQGYCTGFAAAMTVMCRFAGIPARLATGFLPGELDARSSEHVVKARDKHAWTEVYFAGVGWVTRDATEGTEDITPDDDKKGGFLGWLKRQGGLGIGLAALFVALMGFVIKTELTARIKRMPVAYVKNIERHPANKEIVALYNSTLKAFGKRGLGRLPYLTPDEFAAFVAQRTAADTPTLANHLAALTGIYTRFLYGRDIASASDVEQAKTLSSQTRDALRQVKRK